MASIIAVGTLICFGIMVWLLSTVQALNKEVNTLSEQYLDNHPWHLVQLQVEMERMRFELNELQRSMNDQQQQAASLVVELVWNRADILLQGQVNGYADLEQTNVLPLLEDMLASFASIESDLYALDADQVAFPAAKDGWLVKRLPLTNGGYFR